jgi:hypothetical protein
MLWGLAKGTKGSIKSVMATARKRPEGVGSKKLMATSSKVIRQTCRCNGITSLLHPPGPSWRSRLPKALKAEAAKPLRTASREVSTAKQAQGGRLSVSSERLEGAEKSTEP